MTDEELAAAIERLRQRGLLDRREAARQAIRNMGMNPDALESLKPDEGVNDGSES